DLDPVAILKDRWGVEEVFSRLGPLIRHVRARDAIAGHDKRTKPATIGRGGTNWGHFVSLLDEAGYSGWLTVDPIDLPDRTTAARDAIAHLKTIRT
ncbi:MAG TPA: TIM barrel protein, partial [Tepidisphaeraceae bacterium]